MRVATPADADGIHALMLAAFAPYREQYTPGCFDATVLDPERIRQRMKEGPLWIEDDDGVPIGVVGALVDDTGLYVRGMAVHPEAQRRGIGHALLAAAEAHATGLQLPRIWLSTTTFLLGSQALYRAFGFVPAEGPKHLHGTPLVSFEKRLS